MKNIIRLTESDLHKIVKESVNKILKEWDEYNEFDRNGDANDVSDWSRHVDAVVNRLYNGKATKEDFKEVLNSPEDFISPKDDFNYLRKIYPEFIKQVENEMSWRDIDSQYYIDDEFNLGTDHERGNKAYANTARDLAADRGDYVGYNGDEKFVNYSGRNYHGSPKNDINLNVYDTGGKYGMDAQSVYGYKQNAGRSARSSIRDTFNAAMNKYKK
jgi:hypothetical protein